MKIIDLSHVVRTGMTVYPGDETVPEIRRLSEHGPSGHQSSALIMGCHAGTHLDLPLHFLAGEQSTESYPLERCLGAALIINTDHGAVPPAVLADHDLADVDFVIFRTGWERHWGKPEYYDGWPWLEPETAKILASADLKGVGLDSPSLDPMNATTAHDLLAAAGCINLENLANLSAVDRSLFTLVALPIKLEGAEASPIRAIGILDDGI